jgi:hypothetical protein
MCHPAIGGDDAAEPVESLIMLLLIVAIVWIIARALSNSRAAKEVELSEAWRTVLGDPKYDSR